MTVYEVTGFTPSFFKTGQEVKLSQDVMLSMARLDKVTASEYVNRLQTQLQTCFTEVRKSLKKFEE